MLRAVLRYVEDLPELVAYVRAWARGHFLSDAFSPAT